MELYSLLLQSTSLLYMQIRTAPRRNLHL